MKKFLKIVIVLLCVFVVFITAAFVAAKIFLSEDKIKGYVDKYANEYLGREVQYDKLSFNLIGITLKDFRVSEKSTFKQGEFAKVNELIIKVKIKPLLSKEIQIDKIGIDGLSVKVIKNINGKFNFDDILERFTSSTQETKNEPEDTLEKESAISMSAIKLDRFYIKNTNIEYKDLGNDISLSILKLNADMNEFNFINNFDCKSDFTIVYQEKKVSQEIPFDIKMSANLSEMDFEKMEIQIKSLKMNLEDMIMTGYVKVNNFNAPKIDISANITSLSNKTIKNFVSDVPNFKISKADFDAKIDVNLDKSYAKIERMTLNLLGSNGDITGIVNWSGDLKYDLNAKMNLLLSTVSEIVPEMVKEYDLKGSMELAANIKNSGITANAKAKSVGLKFDPMFDIKNLDADVNINSINNIKLSSLNGFFNDKKFSGQASFAKNKNAIDVNVNFEMESLTLKAFPESSAPAEKQAQKSGQGGSSVSSVPLNLTANLKIGEIKVPYFTCEKGASINIKLTDITKKLDEVNGSIKFNMNSGNVENAQDLSKVNEMTKMIFSTLVLVENAAKLLKIDELQNKDGKGWGYDTFTGDFSCVNGRMNIKQFDFISKIISIRAIGFANFKTDAVDIKADIVPGVNNAIIMKITGTLSNPKANLDVASSLISIFGEDSKLGQIGAALGGSSSNKESSNKNEKENEQKQETSSDNNTKKEDLGNLINSIGNLFK